MGRFLVVVSPAWPGDDSGYAIANASSLAMFREQYDSIIYYGIAAAPYSGTQFSNVEFLHIPDKTRNKAISFLVSMSSKYPAICQKYNVRAFGRMIKNKFAEKGWSSLETTFVFEDLPVTCLLSQVRRAAPEANLILRSHNVLSEAFEGFSTDGQLTHRLAWRVENQRYKNFEQRILTTKKLSCHAISQRDAAIYHERFGVTMDGVIGVSMDSRRLSDMEYLEPTPESCRTIIHLGSLDLRKSQGMQSFIDNVFLKIQREVPDLRLVLGGRNSEHFHRPDVNIIGQGFVDSEQDFMNQGAIFLNPQLRGTGVKLKSLVAMGYGKVLITTPKGVEGINCSDGQECLIFDNPNSAMDLIKLTLNDLEKCKQVGSQARAFVRNNYSRN